MAIKDSKSWPVFTITLVEDRDILEAETDAHFHQDPDFLQHIFVDCVEPVANFTVCSDLTTSLASLNELYTNWELYEYTRVFINWPQEQLD